MSRRIITMATLPPSPFTALPASSAETLVVAPSPQAPVAAISGPFDSGARPSPPDEAAASSSSHAPAAAADICEPTSSTGGPQESPAAGQELIGAGDLDLIGEIFRGARKLNLPRFKLDEERFMADIEEPPLFLRQAV